MEIFIYFECHIDIDIIKSTLLLWNVIVVEKNKFLGQKECKENFQWKLLSLWFLFCYFDVFIIIEVEGGLMLLLKMAEFV